MEAVIGDYYTSGPKVPALRIQQPRKTVKGLCRETGRAGFPMGAYTYRTLGRDLSKIPSKYVFFYKHTLDRGDFEISQPEGSDEWKPSILTTEHEDAILKAAIQSGTPVLGSFVILIRHSGRHVGHVVTYVIRRNPETSNQVDMYLFETYNIADGLMEGDDSWMKGVQQWFDWVVYDADPSLVRTKVTSIVPKDVDFQEQDPDERGRCMAWSFVFLSFLKDLDLRTATRSDFDGLYAKMQATVADKEGYERLLSQFYGARRRKTRRAKFLRRGHNEQSILAASRRSRRRNPRT